MAVEEFSRIAGHNLTHEWK